MLLLVPVMAICSIILFIQELWCFASIKLLDTCGCMPWYALLCQVARLYYYGATAAF
jgi:hypothetical protein